MQGPANKRLVYQQRGHQTMFTLLKKTFHISRPFLIILQQARSSEIKFAYEKKILQSLFTRYDALVKQVFHLV